VNRLNLMLIASPLEFETIFGEVAGDAATEVQGGTRGAPQGAAAVAPEGARKSRGVQFFSLEASIGTLGSCIGDPPIDEMEQS